MIIPDEKGFFQGNGRFVGSDEMHPPHTCNLRVMRITGR